WTAVPPDPVLAAPRKGGTLPAKHPPVMEYRQGAYSPFRPAPAQGNKLQHRAMATRACSSVFRARATICLSSSVQVDIRQSPLSKRITLRAGAGEWSRRRAENRYESRSEGLRLRCDRVRQKSRSSRRGRPPRAAARQRFFWFRGRNP